jgi:metallo-beta-lactamase class B
MQQWSGADVAASPSSAEVLRRGTVGRDDPQFGIAFPIDPLARVRVVQDRDTVRVGPLAVQAHLTAGHTPGGTSWTWTSCEADRCLAMVYGDSQSAISADGFLFSRNTTYPTAIRDFEAGFRRLESVPCDILVTPHPEASGLWKRLEARNAGNPDALRDPNACKAYAAGARDRLAKRLASER